MQWKSLWTRGRSDAASSGQQSNSWMHSWTSGIALFVTAVHWWGVKCSQCSQSAGAFWCNGFPSKINRAAAETCWPLLAEDEWKSCGAAAWGGGTTALRRHGGGTSRHAVCGSGCKAQRAELIRVAGLFRADPFTGRQCLVSLASEIDRENWGNPSSASVACWNSAWQHALKHVGLGLQPFVMPCHCCVLTVVGGFKEKAVSSPWMIYSARPCWRPM